MHFLRESRTKPCVFCCTDIVLVAHSRQSHFSIPTVCIQDVVINTPPARPVLSDMPLKCTAMHSSARDQVRSSAQRTLLTRSAMLGSQHAYADIGRRPAAHLASRESRAGRGGPRAIRTRHSREAPEAPASLPSSPCPAIPCRTIPVDLQTGAARNCPHPRYKNGPPYASPLLSWFTVVPLPHPC